MRGWACRWGAARLATCILVAALLAVSCGGGGDEDEQVGTFTLPRTYEQLELSSPKAAVAEFSSAFVRRDFVTAMLLFHPATQTAMATNVTDADFSTWVMPEVEPAVRARIELERGGDHRLDALRVFEIAMEEATVNSGFRVDLAGGIENIVERSSDAFTAVVDATLTASEAPVVFELAPTSDGAWRIRHVRLENGSAIELPFSGRPVLASPVRTLNAATTWRASLPNDTPNDLLRTVATLVSARDYVSMYLLLDSPAQREIGLLLPADGTANSAVTAAVLDDVFDTTGFPLDLSTIELEASEPPEAKVLVPGDSFTFLVANGDEGLDVTVTLDMSGGWRLHRLAKVGDLASPTPFPIG